MRLILRGLLPLTCLLTLPSAFAADVGSGTLSPAAPELSFTAGPFPLTNNSYQFPTGTVCEPEPAFKCDNYALTVDVPADYAEKHPGDVVRIVSTWPDAKEDIDIYVYDEAGNEVSGAEGASLSDPEIINLPVKAGSYRIEVFPYNASGAEVSVVIALQAKPALPTVAAALPGTGLVPEFAVYASPAGFGDGAGEPSIGYNPKSRRAMFIAGTETDRITFPENFPEPAPAVCDAQWEDVSGQTTGVVTLDPILFTEQNTGRTFVSQLTPSPGLVVSTPDTGFDGTNSIFAFTDDDGETWVPGQIGPPSGAYDHQTVGAGPWHEPRPVTATFDAAVYYCSQAGNAYCAVSADGGLTFGAGVSLYANNEDPGSNCYGLHGHVRVAPDGTAYVPVKDCGQKSGVAVSTDNGQSWYARTVPDSTAGDSDPQMALASDGTGYFCYATEDGRLNVAVTRDQGQTWAPSVNVGALAGIRNVAFPQAVAGDPDRATCAFIGTDTPGNFQALDFPGIWYPYMATTYDGGKSWHLVNLSPNDPVQREAGIWLQGGSQTHRNLLDFNEITMDEQGRPIFGYADGCTGDCVTGGSNNFDENGVIARQVGGRTLYAAFDPPANALPGAACLSGKSENGVAHLSWRPGARGGSAVSAYRVYRREAAGAEVLVGESRGPQVKFADLHQKSAGNHVYVVRAVNEAGEGPASNALSLDLAGSGGTPVTAVPAKAEGRFGGALSAVLLLGLLGLGLTRRR